MKHIRKLLLAAFVIGAIFAPTRSQASQAPRHVRFLFLVLEKNVTLSYSADQSEDILMSVPAPWHCVRKAVTPLMASYFGAVQCWAGTSGMSLEVSASCNTAIDEKHHNMVTLKEGNREVTIIVNCLTESTDAPAQISGVDGF